MTTPSPSAPPLLDKEGKGRLSESARADLDKRIAAAFKACNDFAAGGDKAAADEQWKRLIGLLEVQMGRTSTAEKLTMTPSPSAER